MRQLTGLALDTACSQGATYADVRVVERREQIVGVKNGVVESLSETEDQGFGIRVIAADPCPSTVTTLILGPTQMALQIHESCGHPTELDRVLGTEAAYAGTSATRGNPARLPTPATARHLPDSATCAPV